MRDLSSVVLTEFDLDDQPTWVSLPCTLDRYLRVRVVLECDALTQDNRALIMVELQKDPAFADPGVVGDPQTTFLAGAPGLRLSPAVGPYAYIRTHPGIAFTDLVITPPLGYSIARWGVRRWSSSSRITVKQLWAQALPQSIDNVTSTISIDVEALPGRADSHHVRRLIYGDWEGEEYGIRRLSEIFADFNIRASFMLDYVACALFGEREVFRVADNLRSWGQDVQLHAHPETIVRNQAWLFHHDVFPSFTSFEYQDTLRVLEYVTGLYQRNMGCLPACFRSGGYHYNIHTVTAAHSLGIRALSNVRPDREDAYPSAIGHDPFQWRNGLIEIPVDASPDPLAEESLDAFVVGFEDSIRKKRHRHFNVVIHSWSLLSRDAEGRASAPKAEHEARLREILGFLSSRTRFVTYPELLSSLPPERLSLRDLPRNSVVLTPRGDTSRGYQSRGATTDPVFVCNACGIELARAVGRDERCPYCLSCSNTRALRWLFDSMGNAFATKRVLRIAGQDFEVVPGISGALELVDAAVDADAGRVFPRKDPEAHLMHASFDVIVALHGIRGFESSPGLVSELARILRPGGLLLLGSADPSCRSAAGATHDAPAPPRDVSRPADPDLSQSVLSTTFSVGRLPGFDPLHVASREFFFCTRP